MINELLLLPCNTTSAASGTSARALNNMARSLHYTVASPAQTHTCTLLPSLYRWHPRLSPKPPSHSHTWPLQTAYAHYMCCISQPPILKPISMPHFVCPLLLAFDLHPQPAMVTTLEPQAAARASSQTTICTVEQPQQSFPFNNLSLI